MRSISLRLRFTVPSVVFLFLSSLALSTLAAAQPRYVRPLINEPVDEGRRIVLKGNVHSLARPQFDVAVAPPDLPMERMLLVLKRSPEQETALLKLLDDQQDKSSPDYHKWVTPEQFGQQFGPADSDIQVVTSWLQAHGFEVAQVSKGRTVIEFSGTAAQVRETFHTAIHKYQVNGEAHWANANDPEIPFALAPVVAGVYSLHNFYLKPQVIVSSEKVEAKVSAGPRPQTTFPNSVHGLAAADYRVIYNALPIISSGINGQGQTIAVVARSNLFDFGSDVSAFRQFFEVCCGNLNIILNGPDPGNLGGVEELEATLDATWAGVLAPSAQIDFVVSAGTNTSDGVFLSEIYIIDNNLAPVMTESFGTCEAGFSTGAQEISAMAEQAAAQGITYIVSTGDAGAEGCDSQSQTVANGPISVNVLASTPFTLAVGGTQFNENGHNATYWNTSNGSGGLSAKSYIPENVWNESCTSAQCGSNANILAGGGGASVIFTKPSWQSGVSGIPNDGARDIPDVSLTAADHDFYLLCLHGSCVPDSQGNFFLWGVFGTSAAAPSFAGIMALVNQKTGARQGQANYVLYRLAATETFSQCNGSRTTGLPASGCIFNDVTVGNNAVPGQIGYGTAGAKYQSTVGYDLATGLGSVNVTNLVNQWSSVAFTATSSNFALSPTTLAHGASANVTIHVAPNSGSGVPTGDVSLLTNLTSSLPLSTSFTLNAGAVAGTVNELPGGSYSVHSHYAGDGTFAPSDSAPVMVTVSPETSTTSLSVSGIDSSGNLIPLSSLAYGNPVYLRSDVAGLSGHGTASGIVFFRSNGINLIGSPYMVNSEGTAATAQGIFNLPVGPNSITASYNGDPSFGLSNSAAVNITLTKATTTTVATSSSSSVIQGSPVTLTATMSTNSGGVGPTGQVTFRSGGTPITGGGSLPVASLDGAGNIQTGAFTAARGTAVTVVTLPAGANSITAQYSGDANYAGSTSSATVVNVQSDFDVAAAVPSMTIARPGSSGTIMLNITGHTGYNSTVNFSAASCSGLPRESSCSFSPASITGSGSTTLTVSTTAAHSARLEGWGWWTTTLGATLAGVFLLGGGSRRRGYGRFLSLVAFAFLITVTGCGGGGGSGGGGSRDPGTPAGTSTVTVTVTGGIATHTTTFMLVVQ